MANNFQSFARLYSSIPEHKLPDGTQASGEQILHHYKVMEHEALSEIFFAPALLPSLAKLSSSQIDYDRGYLLVKKIGIKLDELYNAKFH